MDGWDWALWGAAAYIAVISLVRLMIGRRDGLVRRLRAEMEAEKHRQAVIERQQKQKQPKARPTDNAA